jgi:hypothetical protein
LPTAGCASRSDGDRHPWSVCDPQCAFRPLHHPLSLGPDYTGTHGQSCGAPLAVSVTPPPRPTSGISGRAVDLGACTRCRASVRRRMHCLTARIHGVLWISGLSTLLLLKRAQLTTFVSSINAPSCLRCDAVRMAGETGASPHKCQVVAPSLGLYRDHDTHLISHVHL